MASAAQLICEAHGSVLRLLASHTRREFEGLSQAANFARKGALISNGTAAVLCRLDHAFAFARHASEPKNQRLMQRVITELNASTLETKDRMKEDQNDVYEGTLPEEPVAVCVFDLLCGMAALPSAIADSGAVLASNADSSDSAPADDGSLLQVRLKLAGSCRSAIDQIKQCCAKAERDVPMLPCRPLPGDKVVCNGCLSVVSRSGYGPYQRETRIRLMNEDPLLFSAGRWVVSSSCMPLYLPAEFIVESSFQSACAERTVLPAGAKGTLRGFDEDGDMIILMNGHPHFNYAYVEDATNMKFAPT